MCNGRALISASPHVEDRSQPYLSAVRTSPKPLDPPTAPSLILAARQPSELCTIIAAGELALQLFLAAGTIQPLLTLLDPSQGLRKHTRRAQTTGGARRHLHHRALLVRRRSIPAPTSLHGYTTQI